MATPVEAPTGGPETTAPGTEPTPPTGGAPDPHGAPPQDPQGLPQTLADGVQVSGRTGGQPPASLAGAPATPVPPTDSPSQSVEPAKPDDPAKPGDRPEISSLPEWAQDLIKETRGEVARSRVEAKKAAAEEAATAATKKVTEDIGRALGLITDNTPEEEKLTPQELQDLLTGERTSTKMARTELAVFKAASGGTFNASALLDSRSFLDSVKDLDPNDAEAISTAIAAAVEANPWLKAEPAPAQTAPAAQQPGNVHVPQPVAPAPLAPPSGGSFAGGPGGQPQDPSTMSIEDFRKLRQNTPRS